MTVHDDLATLRGLITDHAPDGYDQVDLGWTFGLRRDGLEALSRVEAEIARLESELTEWRTSIATEKLIERAQAAEAEVARLEQKLADCERQFSAKYERMVAAEAEVARLRDGLRLVLRGIPDPMHPSIRPEWVDKIVAAQIVALDLIGENDGEDVEKARALLADQDGAACDHGITLRNKQTGRERCAECGAVIEDGAA